MPATQYFIETNPQRKSIVGSRDHPFFMPSLLCENEVYAPILWSETLRRTGLLHVEESRVLLLSFIFPVLVGQPNERGSILTLCKLL